MAPPTMSVQSVQFQQVMQQPQVVENTQIIEQQSQPNFQTQMTHINQPMQSINQQFNRSIQQSINENQQKLNGIPFSVQNSIPQPVPYPQQVRNFFFCGIFPTLFHVIQISNKTTFLSQLEDSRINLKRKRNGDDDQGPIKHMLPPRMGMG